MQRLRRTVVLAGLVAATSAVTTIVPTTVNADHHANVVVNGDFSNGTVGWNAYPNATADDGVGCIDVPAGTGAYGAGFAQTVRLEPDTSYVLRFVAHLESGAPGPIRAVVQLPRPPYSQYLPEQAIAGSLTADAQEFAFEFTTPADLPPATDGGDPSGPNAELGIQQNGATSDSYQLCVDDVSLSPAGSEQVTNGGFDDGTSGWTSMYPNAEVVDGAGCVDVPAGTGAYGAGIGQLVTLDPDTDYTLSFTAMLLDGSGTPGPIRAVVQLPRDPYTQYLPEKAIAAQLGNEPTDFEFTFATPSDLPPASDGGDPEGPHAELTIQMNGATTEAFVLCVDDVSLIGGSAPEGYQPDTGSRVRVNQVGYLANGPKRATLVSDSTDPVAWELLDGSGAAVIAGDSAPAGFDASAGLDVHTIDFSETTATGDGFTLMADGEVSFPFAIGLASVYDQLRFDTLNYYYPARSGIAIDGSIAGAAYAREAGHVAVAGGAGPNQGDFAVPCQSIANQTGAAGNFYYGSEWACPTDYTLDVVGGWYDAGDHGKYVVNGGISVAQLMGLYERTLTAPTGNVTVLADGSLNVPETGNAVPDVLDEARWELEWMLSMQVPPGAGAQLVDGAERDMTGMVHHKVHDEGWTGLPLMPANDPQVRSLHRPSTAATLNLAAAAAQGARLFAPYDRAFAKELLGAARDAYRAAVANPAVYAPGADGAEGGGPYNDSDVTDEFYWAATELYLSTGQANFARDVMNSPLHGADAFDPGGFSWDSLAAVARMDLATVPNQLADRAAIRQSVLDGADELLAVQDAQPFGQPYSGDTNGTYVWGSNSQILNNLVVLGVAFDLSGDDRYREAVVEGVDYLLGRNSLNWSYVTGYGEDGYNSVNQHSRWWAAQLDPSLPHPPPGTVSGGPNSSAGTWDPVAQALFGAQGCAPQRCYVDDIQSYATNELTVNWNAPMAWVASFLADQDEGEASLEGECSVQYWVRTIDWRESALATIRVTNTGTTAIDGWALEFALPGDQSAESSDDATVGQDGSTVTIGNVARNSAIRPGASRTVTVEIDPGSLSLARPERFTLNGEVCAPSG